MEFEIDLEDLEKGLKQLFSHAFVMNCKLDEEIVTEEESNDLKELSGCEVLENLKGIVVELLKFKKDFKDSETVELVRKSEKFETMLQKLEAEVRNHIRIENQLKLHIENNQYRIDELQKVEVEDKQVKKKTIRTSDIEKLKKDFDEKVKTLLDIIDKKDKLIQKLEYETSKLRNLLEEKIKDFEAIKKELSKIIKLNPISKDLVTSGSSEKVKPKFEIKRNYKPKAQNIRSDRKSMGESDFAKLSILFPNKVKKEEFNPIKLKSKNHTRSNSDQKLLNTKRQFQDD